MYSLTGTLVGMIEATTSYRLYGAYMLMVLVDVAHPIAIPVIDLLQCVNRRVRPIEDALGAGHTWSHVFQSAGAI